MWSWRGELGRPSRDIGGPEQDRAAEHFLSLRRHRLQDAGPEIQGEPTYLEIGEGNTFREFTTVHRGTGPGEKTVIGNHNLFLAYAHVAHNCVIGNHTIFSNNATVAGHVTVEDHAVISGLSAVHQFCRIGAHSIIGGCAKIVQGRTSVPNCRWKPGASTRSQSCWVWNGAALPRSISRCCGALTASLRIGRLIFSQAVEKIAGSEDAANANVKVLIDFLKTTQRGVIRPEPLAGS